MVTIMEVVIKVPLLLRGFLLAALTPTSGWVVSGQLLQNAFNRFRNEILDVARLFRIIDDTGIGTLVHSGIPSIAVLNDLLQNGLVPTSDLC